MALRDIDPQIKTLAGWGLPILLAVLSFQYKMYSDQMSQFRTLIDQQSSQLAQIRVDQVAINNHQDDLMVKFNEKLNETATTLKTTVTTLNIIDERGTRHSNADREYLMDKIRDLEMKKK